MHEHQARGPADSPDPAAALRARPEVDYDVVLIGGGFAGSASAVLLKRWLPELRVLVIERGRRFERKVGEATVEVSAYFLHRVLGLYDHLSREHLPKHGLRYWFNDGEERDLTELSEVGPGEVPHLPSFQLDRTVLDQHLLETAEREGCEIARPGRAKKVELGWPVSTLTLRQDGEERTVTARWLIDASGRDSFLARKLDLRHSVEDHPTAAMYGRWTGARDLDGREINGGDPRSARLDPISASRRLATNHFVGYGWWCWVIPLSNGNTSIGVVYNKELYQPPGEGSLRQRYERFVRTTPGLRDLVQNAEVDGKDFMALPDLPYYSERYMDRGWALVSDAASFLDPYYSPGLDHASISIYATARLVEKDLRGELSGDALEAEVATHNRAFTTSYRRWLEALYVGKYEILGDADLTRCAFLMDTALYYLGVVTPIYRDLETMGNPLFSPEQVQGTLAWRFMRAFNRRLQGLARFRREAGLYGKNNIGLKAYSKSFDLGPRAAVPHLRRAAGIWLRLEWERVWHRARGGPKRARGGALTEPTSTTA